MGKKTLNPKNLLVVTWTAYPPSSGTSIIINNILSQFDKDKVFLAGEVTYNSRSEKYDDPEFPFYILEHPFHTGKKGSRFSKWLSLKKVVSKLNDIIKKHEIEVVLGVFPDEFYTYAALRAAQKNHLPFYSWFHNTYLDNRTGILKSVARFIQKEIFEKSKVIYTMSDGMNKYFKSKYPSFKKKFLPLFHGFTVPVSNNKINVKLNDPVRFLFSGNVNHSNIDATQRMMHAILEESDDSEIHIYSATSQKVWEEMNIIQSRVKLHGFVPLNDLISAFKNYDIMMLPHGFLGNLSEAEYKTIFPTRTIPLLYSGKPILAHCPEDTAITIMLEKNKCALVVKEAEIKAIQKAIVKLRSDENYRRLLVTNAFKAVVNYDVAKVAQALKDQIFSES